MFSRPGKPGEYFQERKTEEMTTVPPPGYVETSRNKRPQPYNKKPGMRW